MNSFSGSEKEWNAPLLAEPSQAGIFLQSWQWGEFQKNAGVAVLRFEDMHQKIQIFEKQLPYAQKYWYIPRVRLHQNTLNALVDEAKRRTIVFLRLEPLRELDLTDFKFVFVASLQPRMTTIIDLSHEDEKLFSAMHQKTRYNIKLGLRKGVEVYCNENKKYGDLFVSMMRATAKRQGFRLHSPAHYHALLTEPSTMLAIALYEKTVLAAHLYWKFGDTLTYLHGASATLHREVMAPHVLHFEAMKYARTNEMLWYDFWGIDEKKRPELTRFKRGFGGIEVAYPPTADIIVNKKKYVLYSFARGVYGWLS